MKTPIRILNFLTPPSTELSHFLLSDTQLCICNGVNNAYKKGVLYKDTGYALVGSAIRATAITGLHNFRQSAATQKILATVNNVAGTAPELWYSTGGAWTEITDAETAWAGFEDASVRMEDFIGYCFFVGYDATDAVFLPVASLTGTTFSTATNVTSMPTAKYVKRYRDRLYVANCYSGSALPYRVYFSSVPSAGAITWTTATDFIDVDFSEAITGIGENWDRLMIFTEYSTYLYDQDQLKKAWEVGCANDRTVRNMGGYTVWASKDNVWASTGGRPAPIGNDILELIRNSTPANWSAEVVDQEYHLYLGTTDANGVTYTNCMATYNADLGMWRWRELYDAVSTLGFYRTAGSDYLLMGTSTGSVMKKSKHTDASPAYADNTKPIVAHFRTKAYDWGSPETAKEVSRVFAYCEYGNGLALSYRMFDRNQEAVQKFIPIGNLDEVVKKFNVGAKGHFIQFEGHEFSTKQSFRFHGFTALVANDDTAL